MKKAKRTVSGLAFPRTPTAVGTPALTNVRGGGSPGSYIPCIKPVPCFIPCIRPGSYLPRTP